MVTVKIKEQSNDEIIGLINSLGSGQTELGITELTALLAEVTNRRLGNDYADAVNSIIHSKVAVKPDKKQGKAIGGGPDDIKIREAERFPVLTFLAGLYKILAWFCLAAFTAMGFGIAFLYFPDEILFAAAAVLGGIAFGTILLLFFYASAENILLKLEIERQLRK